MSKAIKLGVEASARIQELLEKRRGQRKNKRAISQPVYDEHYFEALQIMDDEDDLLRQAIPALLGNALTKPPSEDWIKELDET